MGKKLFFLLPLLLLFQKTNAQFGSVAKLIEQSPNGNLIGMQPYDVNADGNIDVVCQYVNSTIWFENLGIGSQFSIDRELLGNLNLRNAFDFHGVQFHDFDGDGLADPACDLYWRKNLGGGNYAPQSQLLSNSLAVLCDVDGDGNADAVTRDNSRVYWQRNLGGGSFAVRQTVANMAYPNVFKEKIDPNGDGKFDFFANDQSGPFFWFRNNGNGTFSTTQIFQEEAGAIAVRDIGQDNQWDMLVAKGDTVYWLVLDAAAGSFSKKQTITTKHGWGTLFLTDLDEDGFEDLFDGEVTAPSPTRARYFRFDPATGLFETTPKNHSPNNNTYFYCALADFDADGKSDMLGGSLAWAGWLKNLAPGSFANPSGVLRLLGLPKEIVPADLENDGDLDVFSVGHVFENLGSEQFAERRPSTVVGSRSFSGDLDGDGIKDLALPFGDSISWLKGLGNEQYGLRTLMPGLVTSCKQVAGADLDNDGDFDIFACNGTDALASNARFYWFENDGAGHFTGHLMETDIQLCSGAFPLDANEDGWQDMVLTFFNGGTSRVYLNQGQGNFSGWVSLLPPNVPAPSDINQSLLTDLDADGRVDFVYANKAWGDQKIAWYRNLGPAGFSSEKVLHAWSSNASWATNYFTVFDATMDGLPDIVLADNYWSDFKLIEGLGGSAFSAPTTVYNRPGYAELYGVTPFDVDRDGKLDLVFGSRTKDIGGYNQLMWLTNEIPAPQPQIITLHQILSCDDNGTPADDTDDRRVLKLNLNNPADANGRYVLAGQFTQTVLDTFAYQALSVYRWPTGSAGTGINLGLKASDLSDPAIFQLMLVPSVGTCSFDAPSKIAFFEYSFICDNNGTANDATDDRVFFTLKAELQNVEQPSPGFTIASNMGTPTVQGISNDDLKYGINYLFKLPPGSAGALPQVVLTLKDKADTSLVQQWIFDNPCYTVSTDEAAQALAFQVFPNPVSDNQPLQISLENDFVGTVQFDILSLDGRVLETFFEEKTARVLNVGLNVGRVQNPSDVGSGGAFFVRVSDGARTGAIMVLKAGK
jgi:hypothetical protein